MQNDTGPTRQNGSSRISHGYAPVASLEAIRSMLEKWDRIISVDSSEATIFNAFMTQLVKNTFADNLGKETVERDVQRPTYIDPVQWLIRYLDDKDNFFWDNAGTPVKEKRDDMIGKA